MKTKTTLSVSDARKNIFEIIDEVQQPDVYYTLTERGKPKAVVVSAEKFEYLVDERDKEFSRKSLVRDGDNGNFIFRNQQVFPKIFVIRDESKIVYLSAKDEELKYREEMLIKSQLYVKLIDKLNYPLQSVELGRYVKIGGKESKRYIEADIIINDNRGNVEMIFEVGTFSDYEKNVSVVVKNLFDLADSLSWIKKPKYLVYYSRSSKGSNLYEKVMTIDYTKFNTFASWKKSGQPAVSKIPENISF